MEPRAVLVTRPDELTSLRNQYGTVSNAAFALRSRSGSSIAGSTATSQTYTDVIHQVWSSVPEKWRKARCDRSQLDRFLFEADDVVICVGQDGLVANVAKYLTQGQVVIGINDNPQRNAGVLVRHWAHQAPQLMERAHAHDGVEQRTMVMATLDDSQRVYGLNEIFIGHQSHQSARYMLSYASDDSARDGISEKQSSSGIIVATGTGRTGWASSIARSMQLDYKLDPQEPKCRLFVREPWVGGWYSAEIGTCEVTRHSLCSVVSEMEEGGVIFADGIEVDHMQFPWGRSVTIEVADRTLALL